MGAEYDSKVLFYVLGFCLRSAFEDFRSSLSTAAKKNKKKSMQKEDHDAASTTTADDSSHYEAAIQLLKASLTVSQTAAIQALPGPSLLTVERDISSSNGVRSSSVEGFVASGEKSAEKGLNNNDSNDNQGCLLYSSTELYQIMSSLEKHVIKSLVGNFLMLAAVGNRLDSYIHGAIASSEQFEKLYHYFQANVRRAFSGENDEEMTVQFITFFLPAYKKSVLADINRLLHRMKKLNPGDKVSFRGLNFIMPESTAGSNNNKASAPK